MEKEVLALCDRLYTKGLAYIDMVSLLRRDKGAEIIENCDEGVVIYNKKVKEYSLMCENPEFAARAMSLAKGAEGIVAHESFYVDKVMHDFGFKVKLPFFHATYIEKKPPVADNRFDIRLLDESFAPIVGEEYEHGSTEYARTIIKNGDMFGAFVDGKLAGFIGVHDDGPFGLLKVFDDFKRRGIAVELEKRVIAHQMQNGRIPYAQIHEENIASLNLQKKVGMTLPSKPVYWMFSEN